MIKSAELLGIVASLGSAASWAAGAILFKKLGEGVNPLAMTFVKGAVSVVLLLAVLAVWGTQPLSREDLLILVASGIIGIAIGDSLFFAALQDLGPQALVVLMMTGQVLTALIALLWLHEAPGMQAWVGVGFVLAGVGVVIWPRMTGEASPSSRRGIVFGLLSVVCMSVSIVMAKEGLHEISAMQATFVRMTAGMLGIGIFGAATRQLGSWLEPFRDTKKVGSFLFAVCVITFGGFWLSLLAIKHIEVAIANTLIATEPVFVLVFAALFLKERITAAALAGTMIAIGGVIAICTA